MSLINEPQARIKVAEDQIRIAEQEIRAVRASCSHRYELRGKPHEAELIRGYTDVYFVGHTRLVCVKCGDESIVEVCPGCQRLLFADLLIERQENFGFDEGWRYFGITDHRILCADDCDRCGRRYVWLGDYIEK